MPPQEATVTDRKARLAAAVRKQRLQEAVSGGSPTPMRPRMETNLERITGKSNYDPGQLQASDVPFDYTQYKWRPDRTAAFFQNAANSATFGNYDRIGALIPGESPYEERRQRIRDVMSMAREDYPVTSMGGDAAGFFTPGGLIAKGVGSVIKPVVNVAQRANPLLGFLAKIGNAGAQGAAAGGAYGATVGAENRAADEGRMDPTLAERGQAAAEMAPLGAVFGGGLQAAAPVLRPVGRAIQGTIANVGEALKLTPGSAQRFNQSVGRDAALRSLERAGIVTIDDFMKRAAKYGDKPVVTGELGQDPLNSLVSLVRSKGTTSDKAMAILEDRVSGLPGRMVRDIADETGLSPEDIYGSIDALVKSSRAAAAPKYEAAEAAPFAETANLERIVRDSPVLRSFYPKAVNRVQNQAVSQIGQAEQMPPLKVYDELKQLVDEEINRRLVKGEGIEDIEGVRKALVDELDLISGQAATGVEAPAAGSSLYAQAREAGGDAPRISSAFKTGEALMTGRYNAPQVEREIAQLTGAPLTAAQKGVVQNIITAVERGTLTPKRVKTTEFRKKLESVFGKPAADGIVSKFGVEAELQTKGSRWNPNVGAVTSQATLGGPTAAGDAAVRTGVNAARGNWLSIAADAINGMRRQGYSEQQLNALGDIFLSSPDDAANVLYPGKTPKPGSVPPTPPPAGRIRTNAPPKPPSSTQGGRTSSFDLSPGSRTQKVGPVEIEYLVRTSKANPNGELVIQAMEVPLELRRQGLGGKALDDLLAAADERGMSSMLIAAPFDDVTMSKQQLARFYRSKGFKPDPGVEDKMVRPARTPPPSPPGSGRTPPAANPLSGAANEASRPQPRTNALSGTTLPRQKVNTRLSLREAPQQYRDVVMNAPEGIAQSTWDAVRKSTGGRLPGPYLLNNRIEALQRKPGLTPPEIRTLRAMQEMKARLEKLNIDFE